MLSNRNACMDQKNVPLRSPAHEDPPVEAPEIAATITNRQRAVLEGVADLLIPAGDQMPCASDAGVGSGGLDTLLRSRPDLGDALRQVLDSIADHPPAQALDWLRDADRVSAYNVVTDVVVGAYYLNPEILRRLGYPGQRKLAIAHHPLDLEDEELVRSVSRRGSIYRPC